MACLSITVKRLAVVCSLLFFFIAPFDHFPNNPLSTRRSLLVSTDNDVTTNTSISPQKPTCSKILATPHPDRCHFSITNCESGSLINYFALHFCLFDENPKLSLPFLSIFVLLHFYILVKTAQDRFSVVVTKLCSHLSLSPSMGAVTLLALGNGAPDVFASLAAVRGGNPRTGFGAILSAGTFVSAFVVGFVGINAAPFSVDPAPFARDAMFYLTAALFLFYVYLSGELYLWQAVGFVGLYLFFVGFVFWMDLGSTTERGTGVSIGGRRVGVGDIEADKESLISLRPDKGGGIAAGKVEPGGLLFDGVYCKVSKMWEVPVSTLLNLTVPQSSPSCWSRFYQSANIALCPIALLYTCNSFLPMNYPIIFLIPSFHLPLWSVLLFTTTSFALLHYTLEKEPPKTDQVPVLITSFIMSVFWISNVAGELLSCLAALGLLLKLPSALLGLTVLAWGNSVGDLVADVALAKRGQPALAMAGCFAGPMFNMLFGLGSALVVETAKVYPEAYVLHFHISIVIAFVFLILSLMGSLLVVTWSRFRVPRFWGFCLVGLYIVFMFVSVILAKQ